MSTVIVCHVSTQSSYRFLQSCLQGDNVTRWLHDFLAVPCGDTDRPCAAYCGEGESLSAFDFVELSYTEGDACPFSCVLDAITLVFFLFTGSRTSLNSWEAPDSGCTTQEVFALGGHGCVFDCFLFFAFVDASQALLTSGTFCLASRWTATPDRPL